MSWCVDSFMMYCKNMRIEMEKNLVGRLKELISGLNDDDLWELYEFVDDLMIMRLNLQIMQEDSGDN